MFGNNKTEAETVSREKLEATLREALGRPMSYYGVLMIEMIIGEGYKIFSERPIFAGIENSRELYEALVREYILQLKPYILRIKQTWFDGYFEDMSIWESLAEVRPRDKFLVCFLMSLLDLRLILEYPTEFEFEGRTRKARLIYLHKQGVELYESMLTNAKNDDERNSLRAGIKDMKGGIKRLRGGRHDELRFKIALRRLVGLIRLLAPAKNHSIRPLMVDRDGKRDSKIFEKADFGKPDRKFKSTPLRILANGTYLFGLDHPKYLEESIRKAVSDFPNYKRPTTPIADIDEKVGF